MSDEIEVVAGRFAATDDVVGVYDNEILKAYRRFNAVGMQGDAIPRKYKHLILIAVNASIATMNIKAMTHHMEQALLMGTTIEEIIETLELASVLGIHSCSSGLPILLEELDAAGIGPDRVLDSNSAEIKERFVEGRGWWSDFLETMVLLQPDLLDAYVEYSTVPWIKASIPPKYKELIYIAIDSQTTHIYESGLRSHIQNALKHGATADEIAEVFTLISPIGFATMQVGIAALAKLEKGRIDGSKA